MKTKIAFCFMLFWGLATPQLAISQGSNNPDFWRITSYNCTPQQCWNTLFVPATLFGETDTHGTAECGYGQNPEVPDTYPGVECHFCSTDNNLTTGVEVYGYDSYDADIGNFRVDGLRGDGTVSVAGSGYVWYAGYDESDCDGSGVFSWPPEEPC